jgi:UDP-N-acetyl-D-glucosamine dehydrogenase
VCDEIVRVSSPEAAELSKLLEEHFRSVNIAMVNEIAMLTDRTTATSGRSSTPPRPSRMASCAFEPGPGVGCHCLPVDPFYLSWRAREFDMATESIELAGKVNQQMAYHCVSKVERVLNGPQSRLGADLAYHDPHVPTLDDGDLRSQSFDDVLEGCDLALIVTAHPGVDHDAIAERAPLVVDLRWRDSRRPPHRAALGPAETHWPRRPTTHGMVRSRILTSAHSDQFET